MESTKKDKLTFADYAAITAVLGFAAFGALSAAISIGGCIGNRAYYLYQKEKEQKEYMEIQREMGKDIGKIKEGLERALKKQEAENLRYSLE